jgi:hypothetical protein
LKLSKIFIVLFTVCLISISLLSCTGPEVTEPPDVTVPPPMNTEQPEPGNNTQQNEPAPVNNDNTVEVVYFHMQQRCVTCLCFEERISTVIAENFNNEIENGKLVYKIIDITDKDNETIVIKYQAFGSQLFINKIIDNKDNIQNITEIWDWKCPKDKQGFDDKVKALIEQALTEIND